MRKYHNNCIVVFLLTILLAVCVHNGYADSSTEISGSAIPNANEKLLLDDLRSNYSSPSLVISSLFPRSSNYILQQS